MSFPHRVTASATSRKPRPTSVSAYITRTGGPCSTPPNDETASLELLQARREHPVPDGRHPIGKLAEAQGPAFEDDHEHAVPRLGQHLHGRQVRHAQPVIFAHNRHYAAPTREEKPLW